MTKKVRSKLFLINFPMSLKNLIGHHHNIVVAQQNGMKRPGYNSLSINTDLWTSGDKLARQKHSFNDLYLVREQMMI